MMTVQDGRFKDQQKSCKELLGGHGLQLLANFSPSCGSAGCLAIPPTLFPTVPEPWPPGDPEPRALLPSSGLQLPSHTQNSVLLGEN